MKENLRVLKYSLFLFIGLLPLLCVSKTNPDSLRNVLNKSIPDTQRVKTLYALGWAMRLSDPLEGIKTMQQSRELAEKIGFLKGVRDGYSGMGILNGMQGNYTASLPLLTRSLEVSLEMGDSVTLGAAYGNIGLVYFHLGSYNSAIEYYFKAIKSHQAANDSDGLSSVYNNLGNLYTENKNFKEGMRYHQSALAIRLKMKNETGIATSYGNLGNCYEGIHDFDKALEYYNKAIEMHEKMGNIHALSINYGNIANLKYMAGDYEEGLKLYTKVLAVREKLNDQNGICVARTGIGNILVELKRYNEAIPHFEAAIELAKKTQAKDELKDACLALAVCYQKFNKPAKAIEYFLQYDSLRSILINSYNAKQAADLQANIDIERRENEIIRLKKDADITSLTVKSQRIGIILSVIALLAVGILLFFVYRNYKDKKKNNALLVEKNNIIEIRSKEVMDSINYAQKIQAAILPSEKDFKEIIPQSFVLLKPKDIVSGDFYWIAEKGDEVFYAAADCTGHGVPGGFMTMLGSSFLNEITSQKNTNEPAEILNLLREKIIAALKQTGASGENKDGMDIALCRLNKKSKLLVFAGANNPLYLIRNGQLTEYKADKQPVGYYHENTIPFGATQIQLQAGDSVYTFSDGYADQFGGGKGKKFKYSQLKEILISNCSKPLNEQRNILDRSIESWKGNLEQVDDILVIGVKI